MPLVDHLADPSDVADIWHPLSDAETTRVTRLIRKATTKLRQASPFDIDARIALFATNPEAPTALDPSLVADRVAIIVKRFLVNPEGVASSSEGVGPFSKSQTYVNRYDKTGSDVRGELRITEEDIDELRPAVPGFVPSSLRVAMPDPQLLVPRGHGPGGVYGPTVIPDWSVGRGAE